jgi:hypothetical protein
VPLAELWGSGASQLRERVLAAPTPEAKLETAQRVLSARLARGSRPSHPAARPAAARIHASPEGVRIAELSEALGLSQRRTPRGSAGPRSRGTAATTTRRT